MFRFMNFAKSYVLPGWHTRPLTKWLYPRLRRLPLGPRWTAGPLLVILTAVIAFVLALLSVLVFDSISSVAGWSDGETPTAVTVVGFFLFVNLLAAPLFSGIQMGGMVLREGQAYSGDLKVKTVSHEQYLAGMERWEQRLDQVERRIHVWREELAEHGQQAELARRTGDMSLLPSSLNVPDCVLHGRAFLPWQDCPSPHMCQVHGPQIERDIDDASCLIIDNWDDRNLIRSPLDMKFPPVPLSGKAARGLGVLIVEVVPWGLGLIATWLTVAALVSEPLVALLDGTMLAPDVDALQISNPTTLARVIVVFLLLGGPFIAASVFAYFQRGRMRREGNRASLALGFVATLCLWVALAMVLQSLTIMPALAEGRSSPFESNPPQFTWWRFFLMTAGAIIVAVFSDARWNRRQEDAVTVSMMSPA